MVIFLRRCHYLWLAICILICCSRPRFLKKTSSFWLLLRKDLSASYTHCKVMKFLFPSLVSFAPCLKLLKTIEVIIAGYENSSRLHSSDGLGWRTWRNVLINSCSAKGRWYWGNWGYWGNKHVRTRDMRSDCRRVRRKTLYTDRTEQQEEEDQHDSPFENFLLTREAGKRTSTHPLSSYPLHCSRLF